MKIYDEIYQEFSATRRNVWPVVREYIDALPANATVCDVGCGNGKNQYRDDILWTSLDSSIKMCSLVPNSVNACVTRIPFNDSSFDHCISIACIHHLDSFEKRRKAVNELERILQPGGSALISMWGAQEKYGCYDTMIKWRTNDKMRYYYLSTDECIRNLFDGYSYSVHEDYHNYYVTLQK